MLLNCFDLLIIHTVYKVIFTLCHFCPITIANGLDPSWIHPDSIVLKEIYIWDIGIRQVLNLPAYIGGEK